MIQSFLIMAALVAGDTTSEVKAMRDRGIAVKLDKVGEPIAVDALKAKLTDADLDKLVALPDLRAVKLSEQPITDRGFEKLVMGLTKLKSLGLDDTRVTDAVVERLEEPPLEELLLANTKVGDAGSEALARLPKLKRLRLSGTKVTNAGAARLAKSKTLEDLDLSRTAVGDEGLAALCRLPKLVKLNLYTTRVTDGGLASLESLRGLKWLNLDNTAVSDAGLPKLHELVNLEFLHLGRTKISDAGLPQLTGLTKLQELHVTHTRVTEDGVKRLQQSLPRCKIVY